MKFPKFIKPMDKIAFVAPSYGGVIEPYNTRTEKSKEVLENLGYKVEYGPNCFHEVIGRSNTPEKCGEEINYYFNDKDTKALLSVGGGELMCEDIPHIDFNIIRNNPKWYMGYSDNTNLTFLITTNCDVATIYGPHAPCFGITPWHDYLKDAYGLLTGQKLKVKTYGMWEKENNNEDPLAQLNLTEPTILKSIPDDNLTFKGRLIGGCMDVLPFFLGTKYDHTLDFIEKYKDDGIIWFMEACDLHSMAIRRTIFQLDLAGWFKYVKGFVFGRPLNGREDYAGLNQYDAVMEIIKKYNVPVVFDCDLGHLQPSMPLITGSIATVTKQGNELEIEMELK